MQSHLGELTYWQHARQALWFSRVCFIASCKAAVHAVYPRCYQNTRRELLLKLWRQT